jgi:hypothetical protein
MRPAASLHLSVWRSCRNPWELSRKRCFAPQNNIQPPFSLKNLQLVKATETQFVDENPGPGQMALGPLDHFIPLFPIVTDVDLGKRPAYAPKQTLGGVAR